MTFSFAFFMQVYVKLVNHPFHGVKLVIYQLANLNSFCLCVKTSVHMCKMLRVKGPKSILRFQFSGEKKRIYVY